MMNGMIISKRLNNFVQNLYKIRTKFKLHLHEKTNTIFLSLIQERMI